MTEIKPVYQQRREFDEWEDIPKDTYDMRVNGKYQVRILYPAAAYEALQKENERLLLTIQAMNVGQRVLQGALQANAMTDSEWRENYMREVEGINNEGDPIGGDPPSGLRHAVEYFKSENAAQAKRIAEIEMLLRNKSIELENERTRYRHPSDRRA